MVVEGEGSEETVACNKMVFEGESSKETVVCTSNMHMVDFIPQPCHCFQIKLTSMQI